MNFLHTIAHLWLAALALTGLLAAAPSATAQEIYVSAVEGTFAPGKVSPGETITLTIAVDNTAALANLGGLSLGWEISQQGGATWDTVVVGEPASFNYYVYFDLLHQNYWFTPPTGLDTVAAVYSQLFASGIPVGDTVEFFQFEFGPIDGPLGATITVDSVASFGPAPYEWQVVVGHPPVEVYPTFDAITFEIAECCVGTVGNVSADPANDINLTDLTYMVNNLFVTFGEFPCPKAANTDLDPMVTINLTDMTLLINHLFVTFEPLPPCP